MATATKVRPPAAPKAKFCAGCQMTKPISEFGKHKGHGDGFESRCKPCMRIEERRKREAKQPVTYPAPKLYAELAPEQKRMVKRTADGFKLFFEKYSGLKLHDHAYEWVEAALANELLLLNVPPGHEKTTVLAQWFVIWNLACDRDTQAIVLSKTMDGARKTAYKIAFELEFNRQLNTDFGRFRSTNANAKWSTGEGALLVEGKDLSEGSGDVSVQIRGQLQQILGMRATLVVADDATDRAIARSKTQREEQLEWFLGDVMTRLQPEGTAICIGQRVHSEDLYGMLAKQEDDTGERVWKQILTPAILDRAKKKVLCPERWPFAKLEKRRHQLGSALFNTMYQQAPESAGQFVPKEWIDGLDGHPGCLDRDRVLGQGWKKEEGQEYLPVTRVISIDPSPTQYCGIVVADVVYMPNQTVFAAAVVDIRRGRFALSEMLRNIEELTWKHRPSVCIFEENSAKWLHEDPAWNRLIPLFRRVIGHNTSRHNKGDTLLGVWSLGADFEAGRIRLPYGDDESRAASELLISEVLAYDNGLTDDVLMALWFIKPNFRNLMPLDQIATRFRRGMAGVGGAWKGW